MRRWPFSIFSPHVLHVDLPEAAESAICVYPDATSALCSLEPLGTTSIGPRSILSPARSMPSWGCARARARRVEQKWSCLLSSAFSKFSSVNVNTRQPKTSLPAQNTHTLPVHDISTLLNSDYPRGERDGLLSDI